MMGLFVGVYRKLRCYMFLRHAIPCLWVCINCIWTSHKIFQFGYYWSTIHQDAHEFARECDRFQRDGVISKKHKLPLNPILMIKLFDVWGIDFTSMFVSYQDEIYSFCGGLCV